MNHISILNEVYHHVTRPLVSYHACLNTVSGIVGYLVLAKKTRSELEISLDRKMKEIKKLEKKRQKEIDAHVNELKRRFSREFLAQPHSFIIQLGILAFCML